MATRTVTLAEYDPTGMLAEMWEAATRPLPDRRGTDGNLTDADRAAIVDRARNLYPEAF